MESDNNLHLCKLAEMIDGLSEDEQTIICEILARKCPSTMMFAIVSYINGLKHTLDSIYEVMEENNGR